MKCIKEPKLKFRYALGLGDIVACCLHSRLISPITKFLTKKDKPCHSCNLRITALNVLFPIPLWKFFFKDELDKNKNLAEDLKLCGYNVTFSENKLSAIKPQENKEEFKNFKSESKITVTENIDFPVYLNIDKNNFYLLKKNQISHENSIFVTLLYKKP